LVTKDRFEGKVKELIFTEKKLSSSVRLESEVKNSTTDKEKKKVEKNTPGSGRQARKS